MDGTVLRASPPWIAQSAEVGVFCPPLRLLILDNSIGINAPTRICHLQRPQRNANGAYLCATRSNATWQEVQEKAPPSPTQDYLGIADVHSGSEDISLSGTPYGSW